MTAIVGLTIGKRVYIGGDSAASYEDSGEIHIRAAPKVFKNGPFLFGFEGSFRMAQLLQWNFKPRDIPPRSSLDQYMYTSFIEAVRECFLTGGFGRMRDNQERGGTFLVGVKGQLFMVQDDYNMAKHVDPYIALGSGAPYALGSLYTTQDVADPDTRILLALEAAEHFNAGVRRPFHIIHS